MRAKLREVDGTKKKPQSIRHWRWHSGRDITISHSRNWSWLWDQVEMNRSRPEAKKYRSGFRFGGGTWDSTLIKLDRPKPRWIEASKNTFTLGWWLQQRWRSVSYGSSRIIRYSTNVSCDKHWIKGSLRDANDRQVEEDLRSCYVERNEDFFLSEVNQKRRTKGK